MAFTTPKTWAVGDVLTAADMNTYVRDNTAWLGTDKPRCRLAFGPLNATQTLAAYGSYQLVTFNSELVDVGGMFPGSGSTITVPSGGGGLYLLEGGVEFTGDATGDRGIQIRVGGALNVARKELPGPQGGQDVPLNIATCYFLSAGTTVELMANAGSAASRVLKASGGYGIHFSAVWLGT